MPRSLAEACIKSIEPVYACVRTYVSTGGQADKT